MSRTKASFIFFILFATISCAKIDKIRPSINSLNVNDQSGDTVYIDSGTLLINYEISDNELIQSNKLKLIEQTTSDTAFLYLFIEDVNSNTYYKEISIIVPDSVIEISKFFTLTVDAFDDSGNQAIQKKTIINFL